MNECNLRKRLFTVWLVLGVLFMSGLTFELSLTPKQKQLFRMIERSSYTWIGYGGARGGAKSHAVRDLAVYFGLKYGIQSLIFRRYHPDLLKNHWYPLLKQYPSLKPYANKSEMVIFHPQTGETMIKMDYANREDEIEKVGQGTEYQLVFVDEATQSTQTIIEYLSTCCRDPHSLLPTAPKMILTMNPGGVGHGHVKRLFVDKIYHGNEDPAEYAFIQASVWDNVFWSLPQLHEQGFTIDDYYQKWTEEQRMDFTIVHSNYAKRLAGLPEELMKAYLFGDWDVFGGLFFSGFGKNLEIEPFEIPKEWGLIGSLDPGWSSPCSFGVHAIDFEGNLYRLFTYYEAGRSPQENAQGINSVLDSFSPLQGRRPGTIVSGHDAFAKKDRYAIMAHQLTFSDIFQEEGLYLNRATLDRKNGWFAWKQAMRHDQWHCFAGYNQPLFDEASAILGDKKDPDDIQGKGNDSDVVDHALDECRYGVIAVWKPKKKPKAQEEAVFKLPKAKKSKADRRRIETDHRNFWD